MCAQVVDFRQSRGNSYWPQIGPRDLMSENLRGSYPDGVLNIEVRTQDANDSLKGERMFLPMRLLIPRCDF